MDLNWSATRHTDEATHIPGLEYTLIINETKITMAVLKTYFFCEYLPECRFCFVRVAMTNDMPNFDIPLYI